MRLILLGTGPFAVPSFEMLFHSDHEIVFAVTKPEPAVRSRKGPPPAPVRQWALTHELPLRDPISINDPESIENLSSAQADLMVVCDYGQILKPAALATTRLGGINLHGSLLPQYRGAAPVQRALLSGDSVTGVSVIHMTPQLDGGPMLGTRSTEILDDETSGQLEERLAKLGVQLVLESIEKLAQWDGKSRLGELQDASLATKAPRLNKQEAEIDWSLTCREIDCHVRGMQPWPVAFTHLKVRENKPPLRLSITRVTQVEADTGGLVPGQLVGGPTLIVKTADGAIQIDRLRPAGKKEMSGEDFLRGHQLQRGLSFVHTNDLR